MLNPFNLTCYDQGYRLGKVPLEERVERYAAYSGRTRVPIHPTEYYKLLESAKFDGTVSGIPVYPLGGN